MRSRAGPRPAGHAGGLIELVEGEMDAVRAARTEYDQAVVGRKRQKPA